MKRKFLLVFVVLLISYFILSAGSTAWSNVKQEGGVWIVDDAEGFAPVKNGNKNAAREEAKLMAYRDALEKALGAVVIGVTEMQDYEVVRDKVFSQTQGIVKKFDIISEKTEDDLLTISGVCNVVAAALDDVLGPAVLDAIGNPRVMALIDERISDKAPFISTTEGIVLDIFEKAGYLLVDSDQARALLTIDPSSAYNDPQTLMDAARTLNADVIILGKAYGNAFTQQKIGSQNILGLRSTVQLKAVLTKTAYQLGSQMTESITQGLSIEDGVVKGFHETAPEAARSIVHKIAYALVSGSGGGVPGITVKIQISGVSFQKSESILESLRELAGKSGGVYERGLKNGLFEVDMVSDKNVRSVASSLSEMGIKVNGVDGQIIEGEIGEVTNLPEKTQGVTMTVIITDVPDYKEAGIIEDALRTFIQGDIDAQYKDKALEIKLVSGKTAREIAAFLSENGIEITGSSADNVEGRVTGNKNSGFWLW